MLLVDFRYKRHEFIMPPLLTLVARRSDGLPLVATQTPQPNMHITSKQQQEAKDILRSTTHSASKMSVVSGQRIYYYMTRDSLCFLTMTEESYPKRLAFTFLDEVADVVLGELLKEFSNEVRNDNLWSNRMKLKYWTGSNRVFSGSTTSGVPRSIKRPVHFALFITIP